MSFRKFGGLQYSAKHNSVSSYYNTSNNLQVTTIGQPNTYIVVESGLTGNINTNAVPAGPQGIQGIQGPTGLEGPKGIEGPTGPAGPEGPAGAIGPAGPEGPAGAVGPIGPAGAAGPAGPPGTSATPTSSNFISIAANASGAPYSKSEPSPPVKFSGKKCRQNFCDITWGTPINDYSGMITIEYNLAIVVGGGAGSLNSFFPIFYDSGTIQFNPMRLGGNSFDGYLIANTSAVFWSKRTLTSYGNQGSTLQGTGQLLDYYTNFVGQIYLQYTAGTNKLTLYYLNTNAEENIVVPIGYSNAVENGYYQSDNFTTFTATLVNGGGYTTPTIITANTTQAITN
jgi:hypothetical protein